MVFCTVEFPTNNRVRSKMIIFSSKRQTECISFEEGRLICKIKNKKKSKTHFTMRYDYKTCTDINSV